MMDAVCKCGIFFRVLVGFSERALGFGIRDGHQAGFFFYKRPTRVFVDRYAVIGHLETHRTGAACLTSSH